MHPDRLLPRRPLYPLRRAVLCALPSLALWQTDLSAQQPLTWPLQPPPHAGMPLQAPMPPLPPVPPASLHRPDPAADALAGSRAAGRSNIPGLGQCGGYQPDLTGYWRGSGGETVEIRRNHARVWGGSYDYCDCVFFLVGDRLIAYSEDTDVVRKYKFWGDRDNFFLIDESGQLMSFQRVR